jgi:hypothetical protein
MAMPTAGATSSATSRAKPRLRHTACVPCRIAMTIGRVMSQGLAQKALRERIWANRGVAALRPGRARAAESLGELLYR